MIKYLKHNEIDKKKWDNCIRNSVSSIVYAYSWYLDIVAPNWDALILNDYKAVMPLPHRKKFGVQYIFVPPFSQQLGVFSREIEIPVDDFVKHIPHEFRYIEQNLNEQISSKLYKRKENSNYLLKLDYDYDNIVQNYNRNCRRNINKAEKAGYKIFDNISPKEFSEFVKQNLDEKLSDEKKDVYIVLEKLTQKSIELGIGEITGLVDNDNIMHAAGFFYKDINRIIFSVCASTRNGKNNQAMYKLVDSQIKKYAGSKQWFDFSGSNMKGIAYFNSTFGAFPVKYQTITVNRLPWWLRLLKK